MFLLDTAKRSEKEMNLERKAAEEKWTKRSEADEEKWVCCERCEKWRKLPDHVDVDALPEQWSVCPLLFGQW